MNTRTVLALNLGSSTLKAAWFVQHSVARGGPVTASSTDFELIAQTKMDLHGSPRGNPAPRAGDGQDADLADALSKIAEGQSVAAISPTLIAHRIVHGGERTTPLRLDPAGHNALSALSAWAPMHQGAALALAHAAAERWPTAVQVGVFDTLWHRTLPAVSRTLPLSASVRARGVQRYGFHGLAFQSAFRQLEAADPRARGRRVVLAHLGSGSSLCAVAQGASLDTTMGLTPLDGLPMATRCGSLDPGVVMFLARELYPKLEDLETELSLHSGLKGVTGTSGDMRQLLSASTDEARLAIEIFTLKVAQGIAAMGTSLGGIDDLVFTGGIGSHAAAVRAAIVQRLAWLGLEVDETSNTRDAMRIDVSSSRSRLWVFTVNEEFELAQAAARWVDERA